MEQEDIKKLNQIAESNRKNAKILNKLINKFKSEETHESKDLNGG